LDVEVLRVADRIPVVLVERQREGGSECIEVEEEQSCRSTELPDFMPSAEREGREDTEYTTR
jgi:hypothetical protein